MNLISKVWFMIHGKWAALARWRAQKRPFPRFQVLGNALAGEVALRFPIWGEKAATKLRGQETFPSTTWERGKISGPELLSL